MNDYARQTVVSLAFQLLNSSRGTKRPLIRQLLPYCLVRVHAGRDEFLLLNREYKPLGYPFGRGVRLDYTSPEYASFVIRLTSVQLASLGHASNDDGEFFFLYGGDTAPPPWRDAAAAFEYCGRLRSIFLFHVMGAEGTR